MTMNGLRSCLTLYGIILHKIGRYKPLQLAYNFVFEESKISDEYPFNAYFPAYGIVNFGFGIPLYRS